LEPEKDIRRLGSSSHSSQGGGQIQPDGAVPARDFQRTGPYFDGTSVVSFPCSSDAKAIYGLDQLWIDGQCFSEKLLCQLPLSEFKLHGSQVAPCPGVEYISTAEQLETPPSCAQISDTPLALALRPAQHNTAMLSTNEVRRD
jgi:hypothetical protein